MAIILRLDKVMVDRKINLTVEMDDKQGNLYKACKIISECGGNVLEVHHDRSIRGIALSSTYVTFELEIKDADQAKYLCSRMEEEGYRVSMA